MQDVRAPRRPRLAAIAKHKAPNVDQRLRMADSGPGEIDSSLRSSPLQGACGVCRNATRSSDRTPNRSVRSQVLRWQPPRLGYRLGTRWAPPLFAEQRKRRNHLKRLARPTGWAFGLSSLRSSVRTVLTLRSGSRLARRIYRDDPCLRRATRIGGVNRGVSEKVGL